MILYRIVKYLKYIRLSGHKWGHSIHSPFVFDLVSRIMRNKVDRDVVCNIEKRRRYLISDHRKINVIDLGSGADSKKSAIRKVSHIAKHSPVTTKYGVLLSNMATEFGKPYIVEFGTSFGISTMYMAAINPGTRIYTIEGCPSISEIALKNFELMKLDNVMLINGPFDEKISDIITMPGIPGLVFIDGNHRKEPLLNCFHQIAEISGSETVIIIDDINYSKEMGEAWNEIKSDIRVSISVDVYRMGIVFFRKGINKKNHIIRY